MKFEDLRTGNTLETDNEASIKLMQKKPDRYKEVSEKKSETAAKTTK